MLLETLETFQEDLQGAPELRTSGDSLASLTLTLTFPQSRVLWRSPIPCALSGLPICKVEEGGKRLMSGATVQCWSLLPKIEGLSLGEFCELILNTALLTKVHKLLIRYTNDSKYSSLLVISVLLW